jgi:hypothetical protein
MLSALVLALVVAPPAAPVGPPTLCHPFAIGDAKSLPWGDGASARKPDYELKHLPQDTYDILLRSDDPFVHGETLRRAALYLTGAFDAKDAPPVELRDALIAQLLKELDFDADAHAPEAKAACEGATTTPGREAKHWRAGPLPPLGGRICQAQARDAALCFLDAGYLRSALREAGLPQKDDGSDALRKAMKLRPDDAALELTASLGLLDHPDAAIRAEGWKHLDKVAQASHDDPAGEPVPRNLLATVGPLLSTKDHDELVAKLHERAAKG